MFSINFDVEQTKNIEKPVSEIFDTVADFASWKIWSPWFILEKSCRIEIQGDKAAPGHKQTWHGDRIGSGSIEITQLTKDQSICYNLEFLKPWKSKAKVEFSFRPLAENKTMVIWSMDSHLPFFLFFMKKQMTALIGSDYDRGLVMLKDHMEKGQVLSDVQIEEGSQQDAFYYYGIKSGCLLANVDTAMKREFSHLMKIASNDNLPKPEKLVCIYHNFDIYTRACVFTAALTYKKPLEQKTPNELNSCSSVGAHKAVSALHTGSYRHLGNAWAAANGYVRHHKRKLDKIVSMYEVYENLPGETEEKDLRTRIYIPVR